MHSKEVGGLVIVIGLAGSGKSTYIDRFRERPGYVVVDDYQARAYGNSPDPQWSRNRVRVLDGLVSGQRVILTDTAFCDPDRLRLFIDYIRSQVDGHGIEPETRYFDRDIDGCKHNVAVRYRRDEDGTERWRFELGEVDYWGARYSPSGDVIPVTRAIGPLAQDAAAALGLPTLHLEV